MTQALARKWRPRQFTELVGQEHVVRALSNALSQNRLHHAYLFTGTRGVGKTTLARILAKALNCEVAVSATPCGVCSSCQEIDTGRFVDLIELDAASNTQVDNMRDLLENALYAPTRGRFKVYIIDEVHMLSRSAFNAMLKTLEEPPAHVKFVLATTDPQKVPVTVLSRCLQFNLKQIPAPQISARLQAVLQEEGIAYEAPALNILARAARGSLRDALSLLDQAIAHGAGKVEAEAVSAMLGVVDGAFVHELLQALAQKDGQAMLAVADALQGRSLDFGIALQELAVALHRVALAQTLPEVIGADDTDRDAVLDLATRFAPEDVQLYYQIAVQGRADLSLAPDEYGGFTMTLLRMLAFAPQAISGAGGRLGHASEGPVGMDAAGAVAQADGHTSAPSLAPPSFGQLEQDEQLTRSDWPKLVSQLELRGMALMLAQHCQLLRQQVDCMHLQVPTAHRHLLDPAYRDKLRVALEQRLGRRIRLEFELGEASGQTPAEIEDRERQRQQQRAIEAIDSDPFVRELVDSFNGRIREESIKPLGA